jgi:subtilase family serine protease
VGTNGDSNWTIEFLEAGESVTETWSYKPGYVGPRAAQARADALGAVAESDESNNTRSYGYWITPPAPDLVISALAVSPNPASLGKDVTLSVTEQNVGGAAAGAHRLSAWGNRPYGAPAVGTNGDSNWTIEFLGAGVSVTKTWSYKPGYVGPRAAQARADALGAVAESDESNNTRSYAYSITPAPPDLVISALAVIPNPASLGKDVTLSVTEQNTGTAAAGAHRLSAWGNRTTAPAVGTNGDNNWDIASLAAGASVTLPPWTYKPGYVGPRTAQARADALGAVAETDESNNTRSYAYSITPAAPDLVIAALTVTPNPQELGKDVTLTVTEQNVGTAAAGAHRVSAWGNRATAPPVGTTGDNNWAIASLAAGASVTCQPPWSYKPGYVAPRTAQARADALGAVAESNESNNTKSYAYSITAVGGAGALAVTSASALPTRGGQVAITYALSVPAQVDVRVLNIAGRLVRVLVQGREADRGQNELTWDACAATGLRAPAGRYLIQIEARGDAGTKARAIASAVLSR